MSSAWVFHWSYTTTGLAMLALSCVCAVGVNISQFACLGRFSAVSFQARPCLPEAYGRLLRLPDSAGAAGDAILVAYDSTRGSYAAVTDVSCACANTGS